MKTNWKEKSTADKTLSIARIVISVSVIVFSLLQLFDVWDKANNVTVPLMGLILLLSSIQDWKKSRSTAILTLCAAIFIFGCTIVVWFIK